MYRFAVSLLVASGLMVLLDSESQAVRVMTNPSTALGPPLRDFDNITLTPDGATIVATGLFPNATADRVYSLPIPADPVTQTATITQLSTGSFSVPFHDVAFAPVVSPNGQTILFVHDGNSFATNTIYKMPITGEFSANSFTGLFGGDPNFASPGNGNSFPTYSPDGSTIYFINNNSGFGGSIPTFLSSPTPYDSAPDWDQLYSVPAAGGTPTAITTPAMGDIDGGLYALTPDGASIVFAPDNPVVRPTSVSGIRPKLFSIPSTGGAATEIPLTPPAHHFSIRSQLATTTNGQNILFIADYETVGKHELFSVPLAGGTPTRISDNLPFAGDVYSFALTPDGNSVAYSAGQNVSSNSELFLKSLSGSPGSSIRVSDPLPVRDGAYDVSTSAEGGQILFSADSSKIYFLGDLHTEGVNDLYIVDTTAKAGLVPSAFYYTGPPNGNFFDEANWNDNPAGGGNSPPVDTINPGQAIRHSLIIDGDTVGSSGGEVDFQVGGSLELTPGSLLNLTVGGNLDFNPGSGFKITDATVRVLGDIILEGTNHWVGGLVESTGDDVEFQDAHESTINGTVIRSVVDILVFENSLTSVTGVTFDVADRFSMRYEIDVTVTDTNINVRGFTPSVDPGCSGCGDVEDAFAGAQGEGAILTLKGASTLLANAFQDGVSLVLDGTSVATLLGNPNTTVDLVDPNGSITLMSTGAELKTIHASASDVRDRIINGLTGLSYLDDPSAWNVTNWNGTSPLTSLKLVGGLPGDFDNDGDVDGRDFLIWQRGGSPGGPLSAADLADWQSGYGTPLAANASAVPEPNSIAFFILGCAALLAGRKRELH